MLNGCCRFSTKSRLRGGLLGTASSSPLVLVMRENLLRRQEAHPSIEHSAN